MKSPLFVAIVLVATSLGVIVPVLKDSGNISSSFGQLVIAAASIDTWLTDFRGDLPKIDIPVLAIHGTADRVLPPPVTVDRLRDERLIADLTVVEINGGPHNVCWTHPDEVNSALLSFLSSPAADRDAAMATAGHM